MPLVVDYVDEIVADAPEAVTQTDPRLQPNGWQYRLPWVKTAVGTPFDSDRLLVENQTGRAWKLWHRFHEVGMVAEHSEKQLRVMRSGLLTAQQIPVVAGAEYIMVTLEPSAYGVRIVDASQGEGLFEMRLLLEGGGGDDNEGGGLAPFSVWTSADMPIEELGMPKRTEKSLLDLNILTLGELQSVNLRDFVAAGLLRKKRYREIMAWLADHPWFGAG